MKRAGLLAGLLVMSLGAGVVAQSPSPEATPYAPDDLASVLPRAIAGVDLTVVAETEEDDHQFLWGPDIERDFLLPLGKAPGAVRQAVGITSPTEAGALVIALRVDGVDGETMLDALVQAMLLRPEVSADPPSMEPEWLDIDGRQVRMLSFGEPPVYLYPKGEVGFVLAVAEDSDITIADVVAALP